MHSMHAPCAAGLRAPQLCPAMPVSGGSEVPVPNGKVVGIICHLSQLPNFMICLACFLLAICSITLLCCDASELYESKGIVITPIRVSGMHV